MTSSEPVALPHLDEITDVELRMANPSCSVSRSSFLKAWSKVRPISDTDPILTAWNYAPWLSGILKTTGDQFSFEI
jgi:hypothetical protein